MNFEDCKKVMIQYLEKQITLDEFKEWASAHCANCNHAICHCMECPMFFDETCNFPF